ncbi:hypothetical protein FPZ11_14305 [Humibacter ginsenosidimutans]|uniref:Uncharacterized protein n=1 Tax=Humibacter ginsenosidimutans TaxID=2599293 RepID=A0A5B8M598_9MICO|nr:hypothetical protein FPZ11_14305 [Humibacter ginsenosidimutans]
MGQAERPVTRPEAFEEYGHGEKDPVTGYYEWYEAPPEVLKQLTTPSVDVTWSMFFEAWGDMVADFQEKYGLDLEHLARDYGFTWRRFAFLAIGLLTPPASQFAPATRIYRRFAPANDE